jgi:hypothetical protein
MAAIPFASMFDPMMYRRRVNRLSASGIFSSGAPVVQRALIALHAR